MRTHSQTWVASADGARQLFFHDCDDETVHCLQDRAQPVWLSELVAERLGVEPLTIDSSHSPFLSRPAELAALLVRATTTTPVGHLRPD